MAKIRKLDYDVMLTVRLRALENQLPWSIRYSKRVNTKRLNADLNQVDEVMSRSPVEAYRLAVGLTRDWTARLPVRRRRLFLDQYATTAARRGRWDLLDRNYDLPDDPVRADFAAVWSLEIAACRAATQAGLYGTAQRHASTALVMSPRDTYDVRFHLISLLMLNGLDASAADLSRLYAPVDAGEGAFRGAFGSTLEKRRKPFQKAFAAMRDGVPDARSLMEDAVRRDPNVGGWMMKDNPDVVPGCEDQIEPCQVTRPMVIAWKATPEVMSVTRTCYMEMEARELERLGPAFTDAWKECLPLLNPEWDLPFPTPCNLAFIARELYLPLKEGPLAAASTTHALICRDLLERDHPDTAAGFASAPATGPFRHGPYR